MAREIFVGHKVRHGTPSGYTLHQNLGEQPCDACARAKQDYDTNWRSLPRRTKLSRLSAKAQAAAVKRLVAMNPETWAALYSEEKARVFREAGERP